MPLTRQQKEQNIAAMTEVLKSATSVVFIAFDGLTVDDATQLRDTLAQTSSAMRVVPKRLLQRAMDAAKNTTFNPREHEGQIAVVWGQDVVAPAKTLNTFAKDHETVRLLEGILEGKHLSAHEVQALAQLPSREELLAQVVGTLAGPLRGLVGTLSAVPRSAVQALNAIAEQKQGA